jgi:hypothetical protein
MLNSVWTNISIAADWIPHVKMVVAEECPELALLIGNSHDSEVILIVPAPRDMVLAVLKRISTASQIIGRKMENYATWQGIS